MKKIISMLVALVMMIVPVLSMAEGATYVDFTFTEANLDLIESIDETIAAAVNELLLGLALHTYEQCVSDTEAQGGVVIDVGNQPAVTYDALITDGTLYITSNFLGDTKLAITAEQACLLIDMMAQSMPEEAAFDAETFKAAITKALNTPGVKEEAAAAELDPELLASLMSNLAVSEDGLTTTLTITPDQLKSAVSQVMPMPGYDEMVAAMYQDDLVITVVMTEDGDLDRFEVATMLTMQEEKLSLVSNVDAESADDMDVLSLNLVASPVTDEEPTNAVVFAMTLAVKENELDLNAIMSLVAAEDQSVELMSINGKVAFEEAEDTMNVNGTFDFAIYNGEVPVTFSVDFAYSKQDNDVFALRVRPTDSDKAYIGFQVSVAQGDILPAFDIADAVEVLTLSEEDMNALLQSISESFMTSFVGVIQLLPETLVNMLLESGLLG